MASRPVTSDDYEQIQALHAKGLGRNDIAAAIGRAPATVTKLAGELGLSFNRTATAAATAAKLVDAKARRAQLALDLLDDAARLRLQLWQTATIHNFGGRDNTYNEHTLPEPPFADKLKILQGVGVAVDRALKLDEYDAQTGDEEARGMLLDLAEKLGAAWRGRHQQQAEQ
jgi:hypothetical protein